MPLKYGSTTVTVLKYGTTTVTTGKYGSTTVFQSGPLPPSWHTVFSGEYACGFELNGTHTDNIVGDSHLTSSNKVRVTFGWYTMDIQGNVSPIQDDSQEFYGSVSLDGPYNGYYEYHVADTYIDIYISNGSLMIDTTTEDVDDTTQYIQVIDVTQVEVYY